MLLNEIMTPDVRGLNRDEAVQSAAQLMAEMDVGAIPVFDDGRPIGMVTDRDITVRAVAPGRDCGVTPIGEICTGEPVLLSGDTDVSDAAQEMERRQIRRVLVSGPDEQVIGIVSLGDLATQSKDTQTCGEVIERVSTPAEPARI